MMRVRRKRVRKMVVSGDHGCWWVEGEVEGEGEGDGAIAGKVKCFLLGGGGCQQNVQICLKSSAHSGLEVPVSLPLFLSEHTFEVLGCILPSYSKPDTIKV